MDPAPLLDLARTLIAGLPFCFAITTAPDGESRARIVQPLRPRDDWTVDILTNRRCRKVRDVEATGRLVLAWQHDADRSYVCLVGRGRIEEDLPLKRSIWSPAADRWNPGGPEDPDTVFVRLSTERIELWSAVHGVMPEPCGYSAALLTRDGDAWRYSES